MKPIELSQKLSRKYKNSPLEWTLTPFGTEALCAAALESARWPDGFGKTPIPRGPACGAAGGVTGGGESLARSWQARADHLGARGWVAPVARCLVMPCATGQINL